MTPLEIYLDRLHELHGQRKGTPELTYRAALENLLNAIGQSLDPTVQATAELADTGAGRPDFGLFETKSGNARGVVEVKGPDADLPLDSPQIAKYYHQYAVVLVTNYREFALITRDADGSPRNEARCRLATDADAFWRTSPHALATLRDEEFTDFLVGVMRRSAPILRPADLAADLARHAREAKRRLERHDSATLEPLQQAMEQALGLHFHGSEGLHFFRSSLVQTLFYGLFSGWMLWRESPHAPGDAFDWRKASEHLALPLIGDLYDEIARPRRLADLGLREPLDWATASLNQVAPAEFFKNFDREHAITLFYEPFLQAFDPDLRKELGVWYTPPEIVQYMVGRVDQLLRDKVHGLGIDDGLADESVYVLDPACGTGSYLVEVAKRIHQTHLDNGQGAAAAARTKKALTTRIFGFEILPAPYVVSHLQLGVLLRQLGTKLAPTERAEVYLTNALTGWEPPKEPKSALLFPELQRESERARRVKQDTPILVILGNPPYNRFAGVAEDEEGDLIEPYKQGLYEKWGVRKQLLDDLYIRFFRLAEKRIAEHGGRGIVCYISNYSWLEGVSHPVMREHILTGFSHVFVDNLHGDRKKSERAPDGSTSQTVFAIRGSSPGIQVGTAIATLVKAGTTDRLAAIHYRDFEEGQATARTAALLQSLTDVAYRPYVAATTSVARRWVIAKNQERGIGEPNEYPTWLNIPTIFPIHYSGLNENRFNALITITREEIDERMKAYFNKRLTLEEVAERVPGIDAKVAGYEPEKTRTTLLAGTAFRPERIIPLAYRPMDTWWTYWEGEGKLFNRPRPDFFAQLGGGNVFLATSQTARKGGLNEPLIVDKFGDLHLQDPWSQFFPLLIRHVEGLHAGRVEPNLKPEVLTALCAQAQVPLFQKDGHTFTPQAMTIAEECFYHTLAILWSPAYRTENACALRQDWPRIPLPAGPDLLHASAALGHTIADLLLPDRPVPGVTTGKIRPELRSLAVPSKTDGSPIQDPRDTKVDAGWGFRGQKNAVMCGRGLVKPASRHEADAVDVYLNATTYWANVPKGVWEMTIGGYPVLKKWLSYREHKVLGRALALDEVTYVTDVVRRLQAILLLGPQLDASYAAIKAQTLAPSIGAGAAAKLPAPV